MKLKKFRNTLNPRCLVTLPNLSLSVATLLWSGGFKISTPNAFKPAYREFYEFTKKFLKLRWIHASVQRWRCFTLDWCFDSTWIGCFLSPLIWRSDIIKKIVKSTPVPQQSAFYLFRVRRKSERALLTNRKAISKVLEISFKSRKTYQIRFMTSLKKNLSLKAVLLTWALPEARSTFFYHKNLLTSRQSSCLLFAKTEKKFCSRWKFLT